MAALLTAIAITAGILGIFIHQWISFVPRLGIGFLYRIQRARAAVALTVLVTAGAALALNPTRGQAAVLGAAVLLTLLNGANDPRRALVALDHPKHAGAADAPLGDEARVLGLALEDGSSAAWPLEVIVPHHIANDWIGGAPVLASW